MKLTNRQHGYIIRLQDRCEILRGRIRAGNPQVNYITEWKMELHALEWAITALEAWPDKERVVQPEVALTIPLAPYMAIPVLMNHLEPGWENCRAAVLAWYATLARPELPTPQKSSE